MSKKHRRAALGGMVAAALLALGGAAAAQPQYYLGAHLGANNLGDWPASVDFGGGVSTSGSLSLDRGAHLGLLLGRQTENARFEVEYQHGRFGVESVQLGPLSQAHSARGRYQALTVNAYRTAALSANWTGFAGLGIGWGSASLPDASIGACNCFPAASSDGLAYQARLGAEYQVGQGHHVFAQLSWLNLPRSSSGGTPGVTYSRNNVNSIGVGWRKTF